MISSVWFDDYDYDQGYDPELYGRCTPCRLQSMMVIWKSILSDNITMAHSSTTTTTITTTTNIEDVLRFLLFLSVVVFLCTALLLQGTLLELGMMRCRRTMERWNRILHRTSLRQPTLECHHWIL